MTAQQFLVEGGHRLSGTIRPSGNKNAALPIVCAALLTEHPVILENVPRIRDVETLVELDVEYRDLATRVGVPGYFRVPTQNADAGFVAALAGLVRRAVARGPGLCSHVGGRFCDSAHVACPIAPAGG